MPKTTSATGATMAVSLLYMIVTSALILMWDNRRTPTRVIEHGVLIPDGVRYLGTLDRGLVVSNKLGRRGRRMGLDLAIIEAMMVGLPVVALATADMATVIDDGANGYIDTRIDRLHDCMRELVRSPSLARALGQAARRHAQERFSIDRFSADWDAALRHVTGHNHHRSRRLARRDA